MKITAVIVIFKQNPGESKTLNSIKNAAASMTLSLEEIEFIVYDNSPAQSQFNNEAFEGINISYVHDSRNLGISTAYNYALSVGLDNGSDWLLLLDHDTEITIDYLMQILGYNNTEKNVAAVVPQIISDGSDILISPVESSTLRPIHGKKVAPGLQKRPVMAINSGSLIRIEVMGKLNGFNNEFPLDYLDHWLFYEIYKQGYYVYVLNTQLIHDLSVMNYNSISFKRYKSISDAEMSFYKKYNTSLLGEYRIHLIKRFIKQLIFVRNKKISFYTLKKLISF